MIEWTGVLARLEVPTADGRAPARPERLLSRPLPLPLAELGTIRDTEFRPAGCITHLSIHGDEVHAEGTIRDGILTKERDTIPIGLDADQTQFEAFGTGVLFTQWRITGATLLLGADDTPPWPDCFIRAKETRP